MSLLKRRPSSLDPIQKQRRNRQTQHYTLIDKCIQIPSDDKMILRKAIQEEEENLLSLLEKYRKEQPKDLKQLQIYLRKYIQRYKSEHPKYPTLKLIHGGIDPCPYSYLQKRNSFSFSVKESNISSKLNSSNVQKMNNLSQSSQMNYSRQTIMGNSFDNKNHKPDKNKIVVLKQRQSYFIVGMKQKSMNSVKSSLKLSTCYRDEQRNYEQMIKKRKTERLKISTNNISMTIQNQSSTLSPLRNYASPSKQYCAIVQPHQRSTKVIKTHIEKPFTTIQPQFQQTILNVNNSIIETYQNVQNGQFLSTMSFKMKVDEPQEQRPVENIFDNNKNINPTLHKQLDTIITNGNKQTLESHSELGYLSFCQQHNQKHQDIQPCEQIKRKLFYIDNPLNSSSTSQIQKNGNSFLVQRRQSLKPLSEVLVSNNLSNQLSEDDQLKQSSTKSIKQQQLPLSSSKKVKLSSSRKNKQKENFNSGKNIQQNTHKSINQQNITKKSPLNQSSLGTSKLQNISCLSTINKDTQQNQVMSYYMRSHRKTSQMFSQSQSHRVLDDSRTFVKSFVKDFKDIKEERQCTKEVKSSRMLFSHRMQQVISGRKESQHNNNDIDDRQNTSSQHNVNVTPSCSYRQKHKAASKLQFWARIQSTINE